MLTNDEVYQKFVEADALLEGHFLLSSGRHSPTYLEKFLVLQYPNTVEAFCKDIAERFRDQNIEVVLGPTTGGVLLAYEVAKQLGVRGIFAESEDGKRVLRRGFALAEGERVLLVDDILTTGSSVRDTIAAIDEAGATLVGVAVLADRSGGKVTFGVPQQALLTLDVVQYEAADCPLCAAGEPMTKRGTTAKPKMR